METITETEIIDPSRTDVGSSLSLAGPTTWNSLPKQLRDPVHTTFVFACLLETFLFSEY